MKSVIIFMLLLPLASASPGGVLLFPEETAMPYVNFTSSIKTIINEFTLCMCVATELGDNRDIILFDYRLSQNHELSVWRKSNGSFSFQLGGSSQGVFYSLPKLSTFQTHLCITWDSSTGLGAFWVDGKHSISKVYSKGHKIGSGGTFVLGQYLVNDNPDPKQSFLGEITDVNMWDRVLKGEEIQSLYQKSWLAHPPNVINWNDVNYHINGHVIVHLI